MTTDARLPDRVSRRPDPAVPHIGELLLLTGPMFAGKSSALIAHAQAAARGPARNCVIVLKPAFDVRDGEAVVSSRDGSRIEAIPVSRWPESVAGSDVVVIDEVQFMVSPHYDGDIVADVLAAVRSGLRVVAGGLDTDYARRPFEPVARLAEHANRHVRLTASCHVCAAPAAWTAKREETGHRLELGSTGLYEARCDLHWRLPDGTMPPAIPSAIPGAMPDGLAIERMPVDDGPVQVVLAGRTALVADAQP